MFNLEFEPISYNGDATVTYKVTLIGKCTVQEFINKVLEDKRDRLVTIDIKSKKSFFGYISVEYESGKMTTEPLQEEILTRNVKRVVMANGGWGQMTYVIELSRSRKVSKCETEVPV